MARQRQRAAHAENVLALLEGGDGHHPRRPLIVTTAFIMKAKRHPSMSAIPLERIVTIDSLDSWDLRSVSAATAGTGSLILQHHLSRRWVEIDLVETLADRPFRADPSLRAMKSVYVFYTSRILRIGGYTCLDARASRSMPSSRRSRSKREGESTVAGPRPVPPGLGGQDGPRPLSASPSNGKSLRNGASRPAARLLLGWGCVATAALLFTSHLVQHAGFINLLPEPAADLLMDDLRRPGHSWRDHPCSLGRRTSIALGRILNTPPLSSPTDVS